MRQNTVKFIGIVLAVSFLLFCFVGCALILPEDPLAYQKKGFTAKLLFTDNGESLLVIVHMDAPHFDENGKMLARTAEITPIGGLLDGLSFTLKKQTASIIMGDETIPLSGRDILAGFERLISLFCIDDQYYNGSEKGEYEKKPCEIFTYRNGETTVTLTLDKETRLPLLLEATAGEDHFFAKIEEMLLEDSPDEP